VKIEISTFKNHKTEIEKEIEEVKHEYFWKEVITVKCCFI